MQRPDDNEGALRKRLQAFHEQTQPVIDYYARKGKLSNINPVGEKDTIAASIRDALGPAKQ